MPDEVPPIPIGEPEVVYHYTTVETMMKIVTSGKIWATSISYLNDSSEGAHLLHMVRGRLPDLLAQYQLRETVLSKFDSTDKLVENRPFIASFSAEGDSLAQWRSYCPQGNGVAIGFRVSCLARAKRALDTAKTSSGVQFKSVEYMADDTPQPLLDECVAKIIRETDHSFALAQTVWGADTKITREDLFAMLAESEACRRKHESFSAEREYRLIVDPLYSITKYLEFRPVRSTLVPYVELSIPAASPLKMDYVESELHGEFGTRAGYSSLDFVAKVIIGPTANMGLSIEAVEAFFRKLNLCVHVVGSSSPFRDW
jgi:Protein of unknown function (DUF2971)